MAELGLAKVRVIPLAPVPPPILASKATLSPLLGTGVDEATEPDWKVELVEVRETSAPDSAAVPWVIQPPRAGGRGSGFVRETPTFSTAKSSVSPPVAAVKTRSATGGRSATVCWSTCTPPTHTVSWVPLTETMTWVVAPWRVGTVELVATQLGMPLTGPPSAMPTKLADGSAPCLKLDRPTATPLIPE